MSVILSTSILSADFTNLARDIQMINESEADWFHLDIMDGVFVPNISYGFPVVRSIAALAKKPLDVHLMIVNPDIYIPVLAEIGVDYISVHYETCTHLHRTIQSIHSAGIKAGVAINPHTPVSALEEIIVDCDFVLLMSVNPGFGGQSFIENSVDKVKRLKKLISVKDTKCLIEVDGGVNAENAKILVSAGANILVSGSSVFGSNNPREAITAIKRVR
ncbi:MAG: ribulose-phosphate 3-epimerase [Bacteroidales bacterium]|nr:ribulose-phosphate 3-epimerase [Bacteroidales bacterium]